MLKLTPKKRVLFVRRLTPVMLALFGVFSLTLTFAHSPKLAYAAASNTVNFQARLQTHAGGIVPDGTYNVEFKLYNASSSSGSSQGSCSGDSHCLWVETHTGANKVTVVNGYLTVQLGSVNAFGSIDWTQNLWLTMNIGGTGTASWDGEMNPRLPLTAVPYAFAAGQLQNTSGSNTSTLSIQAPTGGNQNFVIQNQGAAGTYNILTTPSGTTSIDASGNVTVKALNDSGIPFRVQNAAGSSDLLKVDATTSTTTVSNLQIASGGNVSLTNGTITIGGSQTTAFHTPGTNGDGSNGADIPTKINVPIFNAGAYGQVLALGITQGTPNTARVITVLDPRTQAHQPSIAVLDTSENQLFGLSWDGANCSNNPSCIPLLKTSTSRLGFSTGGSMPAYIDDSGNIAQLVLGIAGPSGQNGGLTLGNASNNAQVSIDATSATSSYVINLPNSIGSTGQCLAVSSVASGLENLAHSNCFVQGGSSFGAAANLGTADSNVLNLVTNGSTQATIAVGGATTFKNSTDSTNAFQIQNNSGASLFNADTVNNTITLGPSTNLETTGDINNPNGGIGHYQNLLKYSEQLDNGSVWIANAESTHADDPAANPAPDGQTTGDLVGTVSAGGTLAQTSTTAIANNTSYTFSFWAKYSGGGTQLLTAGITGSTGGTAVLKNFTATSTWQRFWLTLNTGASGYTGNVQVIIYPGGAGSGSIGVWGTQLVVGSTPQVYVRTTGSTVSAGQGVYSTTINAGTAIQTNGSTRIDASGNYTGGTINGNTLTSTALTFSGASATTISSASGQDMTLQAAGTGKLNMQSGSTLTLVAGGSTDNIVTQASALQVANATGTASTLFSTDATGKLTLSSAVIGNATFPDRTNSGDGGMVVSSRYYSGSGGTLTSLLMHFGYVNSSAPHVRAAVYSDNSGEPNTLLSSPTAPQAVATSNSWNTASLGTTVTLAPNTYYWLSFSAEDGANDEFGVGGTAIYGGGVSGRLEASAFSSNFPGTWNPTYTYNVPYSIYGLYQTVNNASDAESGLTIDANNNVRLETHIDSNAAFQISDHWGDVVLGVQTDTNTVNINHLRVYNDTIIQSQTNSTNALQVQNSGSASILNVDAANSQVTITGQTDNSELVIKANSTQSASNPMILLQDSSGNELTRINADSNANLFFGATSGKQVDPSGDGGNVGVGSSALSLVTTGGYNTAVGTGALQAVSTGEQNTALGYNALASLTGSGTSNVAVGWNAGNVSGAAGSFTGNVFLGNNAGGTDADGFATISNLSNAAAIGNQAQVQSSNTIVLGATGSSQASVVVGSTMVSGTNIFSVNGLIFMGGTASQSGNTLTYTGLGSPWSSANGIAVGDRVIFADGTNAGMITAMTDSTHMLVSTSRTVSSQAYRIENAGFQVTNVGDTYVSDTSTSAFQIQDSNANNLLNADTSNSVIDISGTATNFATLRIDNGHFEVTQTNLPSAPTFNSCGTSPSVSFGTGAADAAGSFTMTVGSGSPGACNFVIQFNKAYSSAPKSVILTIGDSNSATSGNDVYVSATSTTSFTVTFKGNPTASTTHKFYYWVIQ